MSADTKPVDRAPPWIVRTAAVVVDDYNIELKDGEGFIGDRVSKSAFREMLEAWPGAPARRSAPIRWAKGRAAISRKKRLDQILLGERSPRLRRGVQRRSRTSRRSSPGVARLFLRQEGWRDTQAIVVGGGFSDSRAGRLAIARAGCDPARRRASTSPSNRSATIPTRPA